MKETPFLIVFLNSFGSGLKQTVYEYELSEKPENKFMNGNIFNTETGIEELSLAIRILDYRV